jgi:molecular chaperone DnaJ
VLIHVAPHPRFGRTGNDLTVRVPVSFPDAVLGADVPVPTLDGANVMLRIKPGTQPGSRHRVRGKGIESKRGNGDLIVTVDVVVPTSLTDAERTAIEQLAAASAGETVAAGREPSS